MNAFPESSSLPGALTSRLSSIPVYRRRAVADDAFAGVGPHVLSEALFNDALVRERRRADRFEEAFVVALVSRQGRGILPADWAGVASALADGVFRGDLVGWVEAGTTLGVIRWMGPGDTINDGHPLADAMRRDLEQILTGDLGDCSVDIETYDPAGPATPQWLTTGPARPRTMTEVSRSVTKRALDVVGSVVMLVLLAPVIIGVALLVKATSPGPVFFHQLRVGARGRIFRMFKFRTIRIDADATMHQQYVESFIKAGAQRPEGRETVSKIVNDPRVTPVGRFLRRSSLDEVPQFWNVLTGEMSLVGPRPPLPYEVARYKSWHRRRIFDAKPGMTGLWQVTGRSRTTFDEMVRLDLRYARNPTVVNDVKILLATPRAVLSGKGAH